MSEIESGVANHLDDHASECIYASATVKKKNKQLKEVTRANCETYERSGKNCASHGVYINGRA